MKKIILGICYNSSIGEKRNNAITYKDVVKLIIIDPGTQKDDLEFPIITLKPNKYNRISWEVLCDLLSPDNQKFLLVPGEEDNLSETKITQIDPDNLLINSFAEKNVLTQQERAIMEDMVKGLSNKEIGEKRRISCHTVKNHISNIFSKLNVRKRAEAVNNWVSRN